MCYMYQKYSLFHGCLRGLKNKYAKKIELGFAVSLRICTFAVESWQSGRLRQS